MEPYDVYQTKVAECEARILVVLERLGEAAPVPTSPLPAARHKTRQPNALAFGPSCVAC